MAICERPVLGQRISKAEANRAMAAGIIALSTLAAKFSLPPLIELLNQEVNNRRPIVSNEVMAAPEREADLRFLPLGPNSIIYPFFGRSADREIYLVGIDYPRLACSGGETQRASLSVNLPPGWGSERFENEFMPGLTAAGLTNSNRRDNSDTAVVLNGAQELVGIVRGPEWVWHDDSIEEISIEEAISLPRVAGNDLTCSF